MWRHHELEFNINVSKFAELEKIKKKFDEKIQTVVNSERQNRRGVCTADKGSNIRLLLTESLDRSCYCGVCGNGVVSFQ